MKKCVFILILAVLFFSCLKKSEESVTLCTGDKTCWNIQGDVSTGKDEMVLTGNKAKAISTKSFKNFILEFECKTSDGAKGAVYFHSDGYSKKGIGHKVTINNNQNPYNESKTGSLDDVQIINEPLVANEVWFPVKIEVVANSVQVFVGDLLTIDYIDPSPVSSFLSEGVFVFSNHVDKPIAFRNIKVKVLDDYLPKKQTSAIEETIEEPLMDVLEADSLIKE